MPNYLNRSTVKIIIQPSAVLIMTSCFKVKKYLQKHMSLYLNFNVTYTNEACIGVLGIQDICHFTSRDIG